MKPCGVSAGDCDEIMRPEGGDSDFDSDFDGGALAIVWFDGGAALVESERRPLLLECEKNLQGFAVTKVTVPVQVAPGEGLTKKGVQKRLEEAATGAEEVKRRWVVWRKREVMGESEDVAGSCSLPKEHL